MEKFLKSLCLKELFPRKPLTVVQNITSQPSMTMDIFITDYFVYKIFESTRMLLHPLKRFFIALVSHLILLLLRYKYPSFTAYSLLIIGVWN